MKFETENRKELSLVPLSSVLKQTWWEREGEGEKAREIAREGEGEGEGVAEGVRRIRDLYEREGKRLGWTAFMKEFMSQWGPSPVVNHHGQLAKLRQEGRVQAYVDEFRLLQTMVSGWSEEALLGTFLDGLKPWLAKEVKLKQPARLQEAMRMAEILDQSYSMERKESKESFNNKASTSLPTKGP